MQVHVSLGVGKARSQGKAGDASDEGEEQEASSRMMRFKNTKLESLGVHTILLIQDTPRPHQPQLVGSVLVIGQQSATTRDRGNRNR